MSLFRALRKKIESLPDRASDQRFWARFKKEFQAPEKKTKHFWSFGKVSSVLASLLVFSFLSWKVMDSAKRNLDEQQSAAQLLLNQDLLENFEVLSELDPEELELEDI
jgi:hypothetical protein